MLTTQAGFVYSPGENYIYDTYGIVLLWVFTIIAILFVVYSNYWMFQSEYKKDPNFLNRPTALIWKVPLLLLFSPLIAGFPFLANLLISIGVIFYVSFYPFTGISSTEWIFYGIFIILYLGYIKFYAKRLEIYFYSFLKKPLEFELFFREHAKSTGFFVQSDTSWRFISINKDYVYLKWLGRLALHFSMIPITIMVITRFIAEILT